jgi:GTP pyrophosphokinase
MGSIENQQLKDFAAQSNTLMNFKSKMKRTGQTADADIHKQVLNSNYDMLVLGRNKIN